MYSSFIHSDQNLETWEVLRCLSVGEQIPNVAQWVETLSPTRAADTVDGDIVEKTWAVFTVGSRYKGKICLQAHSMEACEGRHSCMYQRWRHEGWHGLWERSGSQSIQ